MDDNNNNEFYEKLINETKNSTNSVTIKWGAILILVLGIISLITVVATAISLRDFLTPLDWVVLSIDSIIIVCCGIFALKGHVWAFIVPIIIYAITLIQIIIAGQWTSVLLRVGVLISLSIALKQLLDQKRAAKEEALRQNYQ